MGQQVKIVWPENNFWLASDLWGADKIFSCEKKKGERNKNHDFSTLQSCENKCLDDNDVDCICYIDVNVDGWRIGSRNDVITKYPYQEN